MRQFCHLARFGDGIGSARLMFARDRIAKLSIGCESSQVGVLNQGIVRGEGSVTAEKAFLLYFNHSNVHLRTGQRESAHQNFHCE